VNSTPQYGGQKEKTGRADAGDHRCPESEKLPFAKPTPIRGVHPQQTDRRLAYRIATENKELRCARSAIPLILPTMKRYMLITSYEYCLFAGRKAIRSGDYRVVHAGIPRIVPGFAYDDEFAAGPMLSESPWCDERPSEVQAAVNQDAGNT
jgi:hypothetical protein